MPKYAIVLIVLAVVLLGAFAFATGGKPSREAPSWLTATPVAHRGLWTDGPEAPENSLAAFEAAIEAGYAIELDVQRTADGITVVIHDDNFEAMTGADAMVAETQFADVRKLRLLGGEQMVPTLEETLALVDGRVPVFVEIKNEGEIGELEDAVAAQLSAYEGDACVMSFNPFSLARVAGQAPEIPRGQLASAFSGEDLAWYEKFLLRNLMLNFQSKPDFIAYDLAELPNAGTNLQKLRGRPLLGWTANTSDERVSAADHVDQVICNPEALGE